MGTRQTKIEDGKTSRARSEHSKLQRRQLILDAALQRFYVHGFVTSRMDDIAADCRLSKGTLYLYFPSKEALFEALIEEIALPKIAHFEDMLRSSSLLSFLERFVIIAPQILRQSALPKLVKILISDATNFPKMVNLYREQVIKRALSMISQALNKAKECGEAQLDDPELTARLVIAPMVFSLLWVVVFETEDDNKLDVEQLLQMHKHYLIKALSLTSEN